MLVISTVGRKQSGPLDDQDARGRRGPVRLLALAFRESLAEGHARISGAAAADLLPGQFAREHQNQWVDAADSFASAADVDAAMGHGYVEQQVGRRDVDDVVFVDLGTVKDPSVIALGYEQNERVYIARLLTFQGSHESPVQIADVERALRRLAAEWRVRRIRIESWQGVSAAQALQRIGLPVELFSPTAKAHAEEWPVLAQRLAARSLVLFPHVRLREELLGLVYEVGSVGVRVIDRGKVHQDHAVAVRGVVAMLQAGRAHEPASMFHMLTGRRIDPKQFERRFGPPNGDPVLW